MRVTSGMQIHSSTVAMQRSTAGINTSLRQVSSGQRFTAAGEDPVAAAKVSTVTHAQSLNQQFQTNQASASGTLALIDGQLDSMANVISRVRDFAVQSTSVALNDSDRANLAKDVRQQFSSLISLANSKGSDGQYLFGGFSGEGDVAGNPPFSGSPTTSGSSPVSYNGDQGIRSLPISEGEAVDVSIPGEDLLMKIPTKIAGVAANTDVFAVMNKLINTLEQPKSTDYDSDLTEIRGNLEAASENIITARTQVGGNINRVESSIDASADMDIGYTSELTELQGTDIVSTYSLLTQQKLQLDLAQASFAKTTNLSLFNYI